LIFYNPSRPAVDPKAQQPPQDPWLEGVTTAPFCLQSIVLAISSETAIGVA